MGGKKILIVSKCPTHPVIAGNCKFIFNQVELLKRMGNDVYFLFVQEKAFRKRIEVQIIPLRRWKNIGATIC